eukprot:COSAG06_NODE_502_length_14953_cov_15.585297_19_plen_30_part_00
MYRGEGEMGRWGEERGGTAFADLARPSGS